MSVWKQQIGCLFLIYIAVEQRFRLLILYKLKTKDYKLKWIMIKYIIKSSKYFNN